MQQLRPTPFDIVFQSAAQDSFPRIQAALASSGRDPRDRDAFLMVGEVISLLRELRPDEGLGEGISQLAALVHHAYLFWQAGCRTVEIDSSELVELLAGRSETPALTDQPACYTQLPERRVWGQPVPGEPHEPLDGYFQYVPLEPGELRVLGIFGIHPGRGGFSVVEVGGTRPHTLIRADGSPLFTPVLPGGAAAGLYAVTGEEELLELAWRSSQLPAPRS